jgi:hypothetical protein
MAFPGAADSPAGARPAGAESPAAVRARYSNAWAQAQNPNPGNGPISDPGSWDYVLLAGKRSPGVIPPGGVDFHRVFEWDKKKGKGTIGATPTFTGKPPAEGTITFHFWADSHFRAWDSFVAMFDYDPTKKEPTALDVDHPELRRLKIKSLIVEKIGTIKDVGDGKWEVKIDCFEYTPPPKISGNAVATPKGSAGDAKTGEGDPSNAFNDPVYAAAIAQRLRDLSQIKVFQRMTHP